MQPAALSVRGWEAAPGAFRRESERETCLQSGAGSQSSQCWNEAALPSTNSVGARGLSRGPGTPSVQTGPLFQPRYRKPEEGALGGTSCLGQGISSSAPAGGRLFAKPGTRAECGETYMCNRQVHSLQFIFLFLQKKKSLLGNKI